MVDKGMNFKKLAPYYLYALIALVIILRGYTELFRAEFWAEDGEFFFPIALNAGWKGIFEPIMGYLFTFSRAFSYLVHFLPVLWAPFAYAWMAAGMGFMTATYFMREGFAWILPNRYQRFFVCLLLSVGPGTTEVTYNLINMSSTLSLLFCLLLLEKKIDQPFHLSLPKFCILFGIALSAGSSFLFIPLILFLGYLTQNRRYLLLALSIIPIVIINSIGSRIAATSYGVFTTSHIAQIPEVLLTQFLLRLFVHPLLGPHWGDFFQKLDSLFFWPLTLIIATTLLMSYRKTLATSHSKKLLPLLIAYCCAIGSFAVVAVARSYGFKDIDRHTGDPLWNMRYSYLPCALSIIIWFAIIFKSYDLKPSPKAKRANLLVILVVFGHIVADIAIHFKRSDQHWPEEAEKIQELVDLRSQGRLTTPVTLPLNFHPGWQRTITVIPDEYASKANH